VSRLCPRCGKAFQPATARQWCCCRKRCLATHLAARRARFNLEPVALFGAHAPTFYPHSTCTPYPPDTSPYAHRSLTVDNMLSTVRLR